MDKKRDSFLLFSERLKYLRELNNMTQKELSIQLKAKTKLNISEDVISSFERGITEPKLSQLDAICELFNVTPNYLFGYTQIPSGLSTDETLYNIIQILKNNNISIETSITTLDILSNYLKGKNQI